MVTPRLEGVCLDPAVAAESVTLGQLAVQATSVPASVTAIALDDRPLAQSRRILLIYATDALNAGMAFTSRERDTLAALGTTPALLRTGTLKATITTDRAPALKLWALGLDGRRLEALKTTTHGRSLAISIDSTQLKTVTPFFELE